MAYNFTKEEFENRDKKTSYATVLYKKINADLITVISAYLKLLKHFDNNIFLLESNENSSNKGRFSMITLNPDKVWKCKGYESFIAANYQQAPNDFIKQEGAALKNLRNFSADAKINWHNLSYLNDALPAMSAGIFGYMTYDMVRLIEKLPDQKLLDEINIPDSIFIRPQITIIFDHVFDCALICAPLYQDRNDSFGDLTTKIEKIIDILSQPLIDDNSQNIQLDENFTSNVTKEEYCRHVVTSQNYIKAGDIFQILPSQRFKAHYPNNLHPFYFYRSLRTINPSPFLFFLNFKDFALTGSSPEIMVALKKNIVTIRPLAGTRKRGKNSQEDRAIAQELAQDEKEIAEHLMLIDLARHDIGAVAKAGSVRVTKKMEIEYYSAVMHLSSNIEGEIKDNLNALDALIAGFPAGTVSGAPKIRAMQIIEEIEKVRRSFYAGCVGYIASNGDMETCITLRSALIKDQQIYLHAGAGVVYDSKPDFEYQECLNKAQALVKAYHNIKNFKLR